MEKIKDYVFLHLAVILFSFNKCLFEIGIDSAEERRAENPLLYVFAFLMFF